MSEGALVAAGHGADAPWTTGRAWRSGEKPQRGAALSLSGSRVSFRGKGANLSSFSEWEMNKTETAYE